MVVLGLLLVVRPRMMCLCLWSCGCFCCGVVWLWFRGVGSRGVSGGGRIFVVCIDCGSACGLGGMIWVFRWVRIVLV